MELRTSSLQFNLGMPVGTGLAVVPAGESGYRGRPSETSYFAEIGEYVGTAGVSYQVAVVFGSFAQNGFCN